MTPSRIGIGAGAGAVAAVGAALAAPAWARPGAALAGALAAALVWFVTTLPGITWRGLATGGFFVGAGMLSWTYMSRPLAVWGVLAVEGVVFAWWSWPWLRDLPLLRRLGTAWLGLAYWLLGIVGALLVLNLEVGAQRLAYAGVFTLAVLAVLACSRRRDLSVGIAAAFLLAIAALVLSGSGNLFSAVHAVPEGGWGSRMEGRFWGGPALLYHPNSLALVAVLVAIRFGTDRAFAAWQRLVVTGVAGLVLLQTNSRTGFLFFGTAAAVHAFLLWRRRGGGLPEYRRRWAAAALPFAVLALVLVLSGGQSFLAQNRYASGGVTSGRVDTWKAVGTEWVQAGWAEKLFGDAKTSRAVVVRTADKLQLTTDNAAVGALRRGGVLGEVAFLVGLGLLLWHATRGPRESGAVGPDLAPLATAARRTPPAWLTIAAIGSVPPIATTDWLLGGTGGTLWVMLVAGEAWLLFGPRQASGTHQVSGLRQAQGR